MITVIAQLMNRIPVVLVGLLYLGYLGYGTYEFFQEPQSELNQTLEQLKTKEAENNKFREKLKAAAEFRRTLDAKRVSLREMSKQLDDLKATLTEDLDIPSLMKMLATEARKVGVSLQKINPEEPKTATYYVEQPFNVTYRGLYVQLMVFLERLASMERIVRTDMIQIRRQGNGNSQYVELNGSMQIKVYRYQGSKEDEIAKAGGSAPDPGVKGQAPAAPAPSNDTKGKTP